MCQPVPIIGCLPNPQGQVYTRCLHCGEVFGPHLPGEFPLETQQVCPHPTERIPLPLPDLRTRFRNYLHAWVKHRAQGRPLVDQATILARFRICSPCEFYNDAEGCCSICGCIVNLLQGGKLAPNKLEWADEKCPHQPPFWPEITSPVPGR